MYVFFGFALIVLSLALYDRMKSGAPALMQVATAIGIIWAGSLIASGMAANAGLATIVALYAKDPTQAALTFQAIEVHRKRAGQRQWRNPRRTFDAVGQSRGATDRRASQGAEHPRRVGRRGGHHHDYPNAERFDRRLWLGTNHLVRRAGYHPIAQQPGQGSVIPTAFSTSSFNSKQEYWRG